MKGEVFTKFGSWDGGMVAVLFTAPPRGKGPEHPRAADWMAAGWPPPTITGWMVRMDGSNWYWMEQAGSNQLVQQSMYSPLADIICRSAQIAWSRLPSLIRTHSHCSATWLLILARRVRGVATGCWLQWTSIASPKMADDGSMVRGKAPKHPATACLGCSSL